MEPAIELEKVNFRYPKFALRDISLSLMNGEQKVLVGLNGSGKTTLFRLILGLLRPTSGKIRVLGTPVVQENLWVIRQQVGFLFQNPSDQLFAPTVWEDVAFGPKNLGLSEEEIRHRVEWALDVVGMKDFLERSVNKLSHGQAKRVALAGIVAMRPKVLLLDEPFTGLDFPMVESMIDIINQLRADGASVMFTTHNRIFIENWADSIAIMDNGMLVYDGPVEEAFDRPELVTLMGDWSCLKKKMKGLDCLTGVVRYG
ncbi:MAG: energy-coupling factor ABC transporter ATP-binding protein [Candidatus Thorarchaeota archaeon]|nr:energy-coupling factor ABC transporter ATP-binding protein [Candidatus Thorarchaeota archaeon]